MLSVVIAIALLTVCLLLILLLVLCFTHALPLIFIEKKKWNFVFLLWILQFILHILEVQKITDRSAV